MKKIKIFFLSILLSFISLNFYCETLNFFLNKDSFPVVSEEYKYEKLYLFQANSALVVNDGESDHLYVWGDNTNGELGVGDREDKLYPIEVIFDQFNPDIKINVIDVEIDTFHGGAIINTYDEKENKWSENKLYMWGLNEEYCLTKWSNYEVLTPSPLSSNSAFPEGSIKNIECGYKTTGVLIENNNKNKIYTWGSNGSGTLGIASRIPYSEVPVAIALRTNQDEIIKNFFLAESETGGCIVENKETGSENIYMWGSNEYGQIKPEVDPLISEKLRFYKPYSISKEYKDVFPDGEILEFSCITYSALLIYNPETDKNELYTWGENFSGQLGFGNTKKCKTVKKVPTISEGGFLPDETISQVLVGYQETGIWTDKHTLNSEIYVWGSNFYSQLCLTTNVEETGLVLEPTKEVLFSQENIKQWCFGNSYTGIIIKDSETNQEVLYMVGENSSSQLGQGNKDLYFEPVIVIIPPVEVSFLLKKMLFYFLIILLSLIIILGIIFLTLSFGKEKKYKKV